MALVIRDCYLIVLSWMFLDIDLAIFYPSSDNSRVSDGDTTAKFLELICSSPFWLFVMICDWTFWTLSSNCFSLVLFLIMSC